MKQLKLNNLELKKFTFVLTLFFSIIHFDRVYGYAHLAKILSGKNKMITEVFSTEDLEKEDPNFMYEMFSSIDDFVRNG